MSVRFAIPESIFSKAWLESLMGQVMNGHVRDQENSSPMKNASQVMLTPSFRFDNDIIDDFNPQATVIRPL